MSKDPAVLFYTSDFLSGTITMTNEQVGQYIRLLCTQHQTGHIPNEYMLSIIGSINNPVLKKFEQDESGCWFNKRMESEHEKRRRYCESRSNNRLAKENNQTESKHMSPHMSLHMSPHMENGNGNDNANDIKNEIEQIYNAYPRKKGKGQAVRAIRSAIKKIEPVLLLEAVHKYADSVAGQAPQYIPYPATWFNGERWLDEPEKSKDEQMIETAKKFMEEASNGTGAFYENNALPAKDV